MHRNLILGFLPGTPKLDRWNGSAKELSETLLADANANVVIITTRQKLDAALKYAKKEEKKEPIASKN